MNRTEEIWAFVEANHEPLEWREKQYTPSEITYTAELPFKIGDLWSVSLVRDTEDKSFYYYTFAEVFDGTPEVKRVYTTSLQEAAAQFEKEYIDLICRLFRGYDG